MKKFFYLLLCLFILAGCSKSDPTWTKIPNKEMADFLYYTNNIRAMYGPQVTSETYCAPSIDWIENVYTPALKKFLDSNGVWSPQEPENNCVKFSAYGFVVGHMLHYKNHQGPSGTSLAIGICDYSITMARHHSVNFFIVRDKEGKLVVVYYDPMRQAIIDSRDVETSWIHVRI